MEQAQAFESETAMALLEAAQTCLQRYGLSGLSTRRVSEEAGMPLSQIHYHFGSKRGLLLALLDYQNRKLLARQEALYDEPLPLWKQWEQACDYLEEDLKSSYVRVLQEMIAAGWADERIARDVRRILAGWYELLSRVAEEAIVRLGGLGPMTGRDVGALVGLAFMGAESMLLLGAAEATIPVRAALRSVTELIRLAEEDSGRGSDHAR